MSISGGGDDVDLVLVDRLGVVLGQGVLERLGTGRLGADAGLEQLAGRLAGTEAGDADLPGDALEGGIDLLLELRLVDLDGDLDLVALEGLDRGLHEAAECTGAPTSARIPIPRPVATLRQTATAVRAASAGRMGPPDRVEPMTAVAGPFFAAAGLLGVAGALKLLRPASTAQALRTAGLGGAASGGGRLGSATIGRLVGGAELALAAAALILGGRLPAGLVAVTYLGFAVFTARLLRTAEAGASCGCFGAGDEPASGPRRGQPRSGAGRRGGRGLAGAVAGRGARATSHWPVCRSSRSRPLRVAAVRPPHRAARRSAARHGDAERPVSVLDRGRRPSSSLCWRCWWSGCCAAMPRSCAGCTSLGSGLDEDTPAANGTREGRVRNGGQEFRVMPQMPSPPSREGFTGGHDLTGAGLVDDAVTVRVDGVRPPHAARVPLERLPHLPAVLGCVRPPGRAAPSA